MANSYLLVVTVLMVVQQVYRQQQQIGDLAQEVQSLAGNLDQQVKRWAATAAKLDRGLRDLGDFENLLQNVEDDVASVAGLLTEMAESKAVKPSPTSPA